MIKQLFLVLALVLSQSLAFAPSKNARAKSALSLAVMPPPPPTVTVANISPQQMAAPSHQLQQGIQNYVSMDGSSSSLPSVTVALKERKIPTAEEVAAKKRNFNLWFWGGGFVAPFLATFYYFGFKFWEK